MREAHSHDATMVTLTSARMPAVKNQGRTPCALAPAPGRPSALDEKGDDHGSEDRK